MVGPAPHLLGKYEAPPFKYADAADCEVRGEVVVTGLTAAPIHWPVGKRHGGRARAIVVCGGLTEALRTESATAVSHWWGVTAQTVSKWRKALGVGALTPGTVLLKSTSARESPGIEHALKLAHVKNRDPKRRRKIAESKRGKPRPEHIVEAMRKGRAGKSHSEADRAKMREAQARRVRPARVEWTREMDSLLGEVSDAEVARRTGRTEKAALARRKKLGLPAFAG